MSNHDGEDPREGKGDATLDRAWRQASDERPPAQLDAAIIASARKAIEHRDDTVKVVHAGRRSRNWLSGWQPLVAAAGVASLAFILVQSLPRDRDVAPSIQMEEPVPGPTGAPESLSSPPAPQAKEEKAAPASADVPVAATDNEDMKRTVPPPPPAPALLPHAAPAAGAVDEDATADDPASMRAMEADQRSATVPQMSDQAALEAPAAPARERDNVTPLTAEDWAARVQALYASGDVAGASDTLRAFRVADPDADKYLPHSMRDWARTVE